MQHRFSVTAQFIKIQRHCRNGFVICVRERLHPAEPASTLHFLAVFGPKAEAMKPKLLKRHEYQFAGTITKRTLRGQTYLNYIIDTWAPVRRAQPEKPTATPNLDDDWFTPNPRDWDRLQDRLAEGFGGQS